MARIFWILLFVSTVLQFVRPAPASIRGWQDPNMPIEQRVGLIVSAMTLEEKIAFLSSRPGLPRLGIGPMGHSEGLHGMAQGGPSNWGRRNPHPTTTFPQAYGMAQTWDTEIMQEAGQIEGYEVRFMVQNQALRRGGLIVRAPNADLGRDPRWGRTEECYGEDPFLAGKMAAAFIKGLQGDHPRYWQTAALLKHFLANSNEDNREGSSSDFDECLFYEYYSVPFRMGFEEGGARCFMAAYNAYNKVPCTVHPVIRDVVINKWAVDGIICTDAGALGLMVTAHKAFQDNASAAAAAVKAGINQFLDRLFRDAVSEALERGLLSEQDIDERIKGTLRVFIRLGLLDPPEMVPYAAIGHTDQPEPWNTERHKAFARLITQKSIVLLKNSRQLLPLDRTRLRSIAVIGPLADKVLLDWYSGTPPYMVSPLDGIRDKVGQTVKIVHSADPNDAISLARSADVAIVCVGNNPIGVPDGQWGKVSAPSEGREAIDRKSIDLEQEDFIRLVYKANPKTIVVLISSFPYAINWTDRHIPAILHMTHCSQELGNALADVIFGDYNPAGRLVQTWPRSLSQLPPMMDYDIRKGRTYMYLKGKPLYPFGYGLSYTTFRYSNLSVSKIVPRDGLIDLKLDVTNTGKRSGDEVVQIYARYLSSNVRRPIQQLVGFKRVPIPAGQTRTIEIPINTKYLAYWDANKEDFVVEPGKVELRVGSSSADIRLRQTIVIE